MSNSNRRGARPSALPPPNHPSSIAITLSLPEIYACLCPTCKAACLDLIGQKAAGNALREILREQLEAPSA